MRFIVDENIPYAREALAPHGEVTAMAGRDIRPEHLRGVDALWVRSITGVNVELLSQADKLRFVGTATAGVDHIDQPALAARGIRFAGAPGSNAASVVDYVLSSLLLLARQQGFSLSDKTVGIVGVGQIGGRLYQRLAALGVNCLLCDPPLARQGDPRPMVSLDPLLAGADIVTLHTPLTKSGADATWHLLDEARINSLKPGTILVNAARGAVVDNQALLRAKQNGQDLTLVLDAWEGEPEILPGLLFQAAIATPHIAGYSLEGKALGTQMLYQQTVDTFALKAASSLDDWLPAAAIGQLAISGALDQPLLGRLLHTVYDVRRDDEAMRLAAQQAAGSCLSAAAFDALRKHYPVRRELSSLTLSAGDKQAAQSLSLLHQIGFSVAGHDDE